MKTMGLIELPGWLARRLSAQRSTSAPYRKNHRRVAALIETCEPRAMLSTYPLAPIGEGDPVSMSWSTQYSEVLYQTPDIGQNNWTGIDNSYDIIQVDGSSGHETLTLDFRNGAFSQSPADPTIQFTGTEPILGNTLVIEGNPGSNVTLTPAWQLIFTDPQSRSTTVEYGAGVSHVNIDLPEPASSLILLSIAALLALRRRDHETDPSIAGV